MPVERAFTDWTEIERRASTSARLEELSLEDEAGVHQVSSQPAMEFRGLPPATEIPIIKELHVGSDDESAMRAVRPYLEDKYKAYVQWGQSEVLPEGDTLRQAFEQLAEGGRFIVGGPVSCAHQVREHVERLGATSFLFRFQWPGMPQELVLSSMRRAAEEVFPLLRWSWIFVFRAIQLADVSKVAPIDKLSMPLGILLAILFLQERPTAINWVGIALITGGAYLATLKA